MWPLPQAEVWRHQAADRYFTASAVSGPEAVFNTRLVRFDVEIGDGRVGRAVAADRTVDAIDDEDRAEMVSRALNSFIDRTSREEVEHHLTGIRGIYLNDLELRGA